MVRKGDYKEGILLMKIVDTPNFDVVIIGAGANGSHFFRNLLQDISCYGSRLKNCKFTIVDGDQVEKKNLNNQLFDSDDVGAYKVQALVDRYGEHYQVDCAAVATYVTTLEDLEKLFRGPKGLQRILVGCVDNNRTRQLMHEYFESSSDLIYVDVGVEGVILKDELPKEMDDKESIIMSSGFSGQIVIGFRKDNTTVLPSVADVYPTILTDFESAFPTQACAEVKDNPQRVETNKMAAQFANIILNNLFHTGELLQEEITFNARLGTSVVSYIDVRKEREYIKLIREENNNEQQQLCIVS
ncbi:conserved hypothetical protein (plasmid) [Lysinibacillus sphaericus C3-41]|uniref:THIF-type NAD/FAD binding fold domain-containing protein n=2 Tax=Bacillaceae TaxID=186817 RepID=B1I0B4_LYSSC|nr:conserved hypothetical protein [Lysinibacillus sphaericus C3-41]